MENDLTHLAIIMDGNGRWAEKHGLTRAEGHKAGAERVIDLVNLLKDTSIKYLTLYAFSTENWKRSDEEVNAIMDLLCDFLDHYTEELIRNKVRLLVSGSRERMPERCLKRLDHTIEVTSKDYERTVIFALNYGGRMEITDAVRKIAAKIQNGSLKTEDITEDVIAENLYLPEIPDPDLMIRTSGEIRISNFLLWKISYSELYFADVLWPDFDKDELFKAIDTYKNRKRRFGGRK